MKKIIFLALIAISFIANSQEVKYSRGTEFVSKNGVFVYVIGEDNTSFYVMRKGTKGTEIQNNLEKYNKKTFELDWVVDVNYGKEFNDKTSICTFYRPDIVIGKKEISFFIVWHDKAKETLAVYIKSIDIKTGVQKRPMEMLCEDKKENVDFGYNFSFSKDTSLILVKYNHRFSTKSGMLHTQTLLADFNCYKKVKLFDLKTREEIFTKDLPLTDGKRDLGCTSVQTDNIGNLLCIYAYTVQQEARGMVYKIAADGGGIAKMPLASKTLKLFDLNISVNDHAYLTSNVLEYQENYNYAVITGIFNDIPCKGKKCVRGAGNYFMKVDLNTAKVITSTFEYFDEKTNKIYLDLEDYNADFKKLFAIESMIDKVTEDVYSISAGYTQTIFVTRFDKNGKVIWTRVIPRSTYTIAGFAYAIKNKNFYFMTLENPKNIETVDIDNFEIKKVRTFSVATGQNLVCYALNKEGKLSRSLLSINEKRTANFIPSGIENLSSRSSVYQLINGKMEQFALFDFK